MFGWVFLLVVVVVVCLVVFCRHSSCTSSGVRSFVRGAGEGGISVLIESASARKRGKELWCGNADCLHEFESTKISTNISISIAEVPK